MNWKDYSINLGRVREGSKTKFTYTPTKTLEIDRVIPGCGGCTKAEYKDGLLHVVFSAGSIPKHLKEKEFQDVVKSIIIKYMDSTEDSLTFQAKIVKA